MRKGFLNDPPITMGYNKLTIVFGVFVTVAVASVNGAKYVPKWKKQVKLQVVLILVLV